jgi:phage/plasmid-like protein (TIGR03299 family)
MAHEIFGERFLGRREPAWHGLGQTFDAPIGALEAVETAGLDYEVDMLPMFVKIPGTKKQIPAGKNAIVRQPTSDDNEYRVFGYCKDNYGLLQNTMLGEILDPLTERWPVESVGALQDGKTIFLTLDAGNGSVDGEEINQYFLFTETKDGLTSAKFAFTPVRVVCQNTLVAGLRQAVVNASLSHHSGFEADLNWRTSLLYELQDVQQQVMEAFGFLAATEITTKQATAIFKAAYPDPKAPAKVQIAQELRAADELGESGEWIDLEKREKWLESTIARMNARQEAAGELFGKINDEHPGIARTGWAAYNAVVELEDYRGKETEGSLASALFGDRARAKKRAFNEAMVYVR